MKYLSPCLACTLDCAFYGGPMCMSNLVMLAGDHTPITLGLHIGLNHVFGDSGVPPCVRGAMGSAHWSIQPQAFTAPSSKGRVELAR